MSRESLTKIQKLVDELVNSNNAQERLRIAREIQQITQAAAADRLPREEQPEYRSHARLAAV